MDKPENLGLWKRFWILWIFLVVQSSPNMSRNVDEILAQIEELRERQQLIKKQKSQSENSFQFWNEIENRKVRGISRTNFYDLEANLSMVSSYLSSNKRNPIKDQKHFQIFDRIVERLPIYEEILLNILNQQKSKTERTNLYYLYFFYDSFRHKEPGIGQAILQISRNNAKLINIDDSSEEYFGYKEFNISTIDFNLKSKKSEKILYLKIYSKTDEIIDDLLLGGYITFEYDHIVLGSVCLVPCHAADPAPALLSFTSNRGEFGKIQKAIFEILQLRRYNYLKIPKEVISNTTMDTFLSNFSEKPIKRFIENYTPQVFIAAPNLSVSSSNFKSNQKAIEIVKNSIKSYHKNNIEISNYETQIKVELDHIEKPPSFARLKRTRFFILIYTHTDKASLTLIQLGWALNHCKHILFFYKKNSISNNILRLSDYPNVQLIEFNSLSNKNDIDNIIKKINDLISSSIRDLIKLS